jgi:NAD(P)H-hydrate repair Nnr-like enzyme with NAD(P)H-hydrate epimerase domain
VVKRLRAAVADTVQLVDGRRRPLVQVDLPIGLEGTAERAG